MEKRMIFHIDVNNAFLSWTAVYLLNKGFKKDIRKVPAIIGGDEKSRRGIVLAKSPVAKKFGIVTAETLYSARKKCKQLGQKLHPHYLLLPLCRVLIKFNCYYVQRTNPPILSLIFPFTFCIQMLWLQVVDIVITTLIMYRKCCRSVSYFSSSDSCYCDLTFLFTS